MLIHVQRVVIETFNIVLYKFTQCIDEKFTGSSFLAEHFKLLLICIWKASTCYSVGGRIKNCFNKTPVRLHLHSFKARHISYEVHLIWRKLKFVPRNFFSPSGDTPSSGGVETIVNTARVYDNRYTLERNSLCPQSSSPIFAQEEIILQ